MKIRKIARMRMFNSRKAFMAEVAFWIIRILVLALSIVALVAMKNSAINNLTKTHDLEYKIILNRMIYSPTALAYVEPDTGRAYPGIIDMSKFNEEHLNESLMTNAPLALRMYLKGTGTAYIKDKAGKLKKDTVTIDKEIYYDKDQYDYMLPLTAFQQYKRINDTRLVVIQDGNYRIPGFLYMEMIIGS